MSHYSDQYENNNFENYMKKLHEAFPDEEPRVGNLNNKVVEIQDNGGAEGLKQALKRQNIRAVASYRGKVDNAPVGVTGTNKYMKKIKKGVEVDVYDVLEAYDVSHAIGHAVKKLLMAGQRGNKCYIEDLSEAIQSIEREIERQGE